jgi:pimeloyl-ACP methyl ester carboxylesterase
MTIRASETWFRSGAGRCAATVRLPRSDGPHPGVVIAHGFACHRHMRLTPFVDALVDAGVAVLTFDPRHLGESEGEPRRLVDPERMVEDTHAAVAHLRSWPGAGEAVGLLGISLGGGLAMQVAIEDPSVAALAHLVGYTRSAMERSAAETAALVALVQADLEADGDEPVTIAVCGWPGQAAVIPTYDAMYGFDLLNESGDEVNRTPARSLVGLATFAPGDRASELECPVLYYACEDDVVTPFAATADAIDATAHHEIVTYRGSHFDVFAGERRDHAAGTVAVFLARTLGARQPAAPARR